MKLSIALSVLVLSAACACAQDADEKAVKEISRRFAAAWNKGDAAGVAALYAPDAVLTSPAGTTARGREAIQQGVAEDLRRMAGSRIAFSAEELRPVGAEAIVWRCEWKMTGLKDGGSAKGTGLAVVAKSGNEWLIVEDIAAMTPAGPPVPKKKPAHGHDHGDGGHGHDHGAGGHDH